MFIIFFEYLRRRRRSNFWDDVISLLMMRLWHGTICRFDLPVVSLGMLVIFPLLLLHKYNQVIIIMFSFNSSSCTTSTTTKSSSLQILLTWQSRNVGKDKDKEMQTKTKPNTKTMTLHDETAESRCLQCGRKFHSAYSAHIILRSGLGDSLACEW